MLAACCALVEAMAQIAQLTPFHASPTCIGPAVMGAGLQTRSAMACLDRVSSNPGAVIAANFTVRHFVSGVSSC